MRNLSVVFFVGFIALAFGADGQAVENRRSTTGESLVFSPKSPAPVADSDPSNFYGCEKGQYSGARAGASVYTKDRFVWAVSRSFAAAYCMPSEYVDEEMKGPVQAIAYRIVEDLDEQRCSAVRGENSCRGGFEHSLEIYYSHEAFEKNGAQRVYSPISAPSKLLISERPEVRRRRLAQRGVDVPQSAQVFLYGQFAMSAITKGGAQPLLGAFRVRGYYESLLEDVDYVWIAVPRGFSALNDWKNAADRGLYVMVDYPKNIGGAPSRVVRGVSSYQWAVKVPRRIEAAMIDEDKNAQPGGR